MKQDDKLPDVGDSKDFELPSETYVCHTEHAEGFAADLHDVVGVTATENRLLRKLDTVIIPLAALAYFVNYLVMKAPSEDSLPLSYC
jgi:hypothetical protein